MADPGVISEETRIYAAFTCIIGDQKVTIPYYEAAHWGVILTDWAARQKKLRDESDDLAERRGEES